MEFLERDKWIPLWVAIVCKNVPMTHFSGRGSIIVIACSKESVTSRRATDLVNAPAGHPFPFYRSPQRVRDLLEVAQVSLGCWAVRQLCGPPLKLGDP